MGVPKPDLDFRLHFVERAPLFRGLSPAAHSELLVLAHERRVARKQCFLEEGEPAREILILCAGRVKMTQLAPSGQQIILRLTGPGEVFGGLGVARGGTYPATAEALEPSHALGWSRAELHAFAETHPLVLQNTIRIVSERLRSLEHRYLELATERVPQRLAHALLRLVGHMGRPADGGALVSFSREELAQMTGTTLFTVSRIVSEWETHGLVLPRREGVVVVDTEGLVSVAEGAESFPQSGAAGAEQNAGASSATSRAAARR